MGVRRLCSIFFVLIKLMMRNLFFLQNMSILSPLFPLAFVLYSAYYVYSRSMTASEHVLLFVFAFGIIMCKITNRLVVSGHFLRLGVESCRFIGSAFTDRTHDAKWNAAVGFRVRRTRHHDGEKLLECPAVDPWIRPVVGDAGTKNDQVRCILFRPFFS